MHVHMHTTKKNSRTYNNYNKNKKSQMSSSIQLQVLSESKNSKKWRVPLTEDAFKDLISKDDPTSNIVFGDGSLFSPLLFGKFFDPSDKFPLWDFESDVLLSKAQKSSQGAVDWFGKDDESVLKAEIPGFCRNTIKVSVEQEKVVEISGQWKTQNTIEQKDWQIGRWWEFGFVRRIELPDNANSSKIEAFLKKDSLLEIKVPKTISA